MIGDLQLGLTPWRDGRVGDVASLCEQAELAESLGFHSFWLPENHFSGPAAIPAPLLLLAAVAARTRRLRVGTTSFLLPVRHPIHVAEEVAVLDRLSEGRVILGLGRGFRRALFRAFDVPPAEKRDRFEAALEVMLGAWRGEPVAWEDGEGSAPVCVAPLPVQKPHPPLWVAAFGPKAVNQAGRLGLPYLASPLEPLSRLVENYARHRDALAEAGHDAPLAVPVMRTLFASRSEGRLRAAREALERQASVIARTASPAIRRATAVDVDDWAIVGEPEAVAEGIVRYREKLGVTHLIARAQIPGVDPEDLEESLHLLSRLGA